MRKFWVIAAVACMLALSAGRAARVGAAAPPPVAVAAAPRTVVVTIRGGAFTPVRVAIRAGESVTWVNGDDRDHTVTATDGSFNSGNIGPGGSFSFRFPKGGNYSYGCSLHPRMRGAIVVQ